MNIFGVSLGSLSSPKPVSNKALPATFPGATQSLHTGDTLINVALGSTHTSQPPGDTGDTMEGDR